MKEACVPITGDCTSGRKRFLWVVSLKGKLKVSLRFLKKGVAASVSLLRRGGVLYMRVTLLVNLLRSTRRAGKVEHMSSALALVGLTHISYMHSELPFMLELASSPLVKLPCSPPRTIPAFGRLARKGGCTSSAAGGIVGSSSARCRPSTGCVL